MLAHEHYHEGEKALMQANTAIDPSRLIGLAQGHFLAAQVAMMAEDPIHKQNTGQPAEKWLEVLAQGYGPDGRPVKN